MKMNKKILDFIRRDCLDRFLRYVKIWSTSNEDSNTHPSTLQQVEFGKILMKELIKEEITDVSQDEFGYIYAFLSASEGYAQGPAIGLIAHLDTSPAVSGKNVNPVIHKNYNGKPIKFDQNKHLTLSFEDSKQLENYLGLDLITAQGDTLLGADDKAGIAEIMTACAAWKRFPEDLKHGPIHIIFTPDEEIGKGTKNIDLKKLPKVCYTVDGSEMGQLETECFDAWGIDITFEGLNVHPGYAKDIMVNAIHIACRFLSEIPEFESPERTEKREGFYHLMNLEGSEEKAQANLILRDFVLENNEKRMRYLKSLSEVYKNRYPGLKLELDVKHQYENMINYLQEARKIIEFAKKAIESTGLEVKSHSIRGGTDGARLSALGIPTPNIFTGGILFHSKKEYIPTLALQKATEALLYLADFWKDEKDEKYKKN
ncbi:MAG: peptidase T [Candidatus Lokiarchaeota archaeon]|nr:peptidase T [Candidatus Lokiarchaeota archaeon]MBD3343277.1 peptidase T [Candidatus Lokiarchaeota archaeon]